MAKQTIIQNINLSGLSDSRYQGGGGSVYKCAGFDVHSEPGNIHTQRKFDTVSSTPMGTNEYSIMITCPIGDTYIFGFDGNIYKRTYAGVFSTVYADDSATYQSAGFVISKIYDAVFFRNKIYVSCAITGYGGVGLTNGNYLLTYDFAIAGTTPDFTTSLTYSTYEALLTTNVLQFLPLHIHEDSVYIGDSNKLARKISGLALETNVLDLPERQEIQKINSFQGSIVIGTYRIYNNVSTSYTSDRKEGACKFYLWKGIQDESWTTESDDIDEFGVYQMFYHKGQLLLCLGDKGNIYRYDGYQASLYKKIPGQWHLTNTQGAICTAVLKDTLNNTTLLAYAETSGDPLAIEIGGTNISYAIYSLGGYSSDYPDVLTLSYLPNNTTGYISDMKYIGSNLFLTGRGVMESLGNNRFDGSYIETRMIYNYTPNPINVKVTVHYNSIPTGGSISILISTDSGTTYTAFTSTVDSIRSVVETNVMRGNTSSGTVYQNSSYQIKVVSSGGKAIKFDWIKIEELND